MWNQSQNTRGWTCEHTNNIQRNWRNANLLCLRSHLPHGAWVADCCCRTFGASAMGTGAGNVSPSTHVQCAKHVTDSLMAWEWAASPPLHKYLVMPLATDRDLTNVDLRHSNRKAIVAKLTHPGVRPNQPAIINSQVGNNFQWPQNYRKTLTTVVVCCSSVLYLHLY